MCEWKIIQGNSPKQKTSNHNNQYDIKIHRPRSTILDSSQKNLMNHSNSTEADNGASYLLEEQEQTSRWIYTQKNHLKSVPVAMPYSHLVMTTFHQTSLSVVHIKLNSIEELQILLQLLQGRGPHQLQWEHPVSSTKDCLLNCMTLNKNYSSARTFFHVMDIIIFYRTLDYFNEAAKVLEAYLLNKKSRSS